MEVQDCLKCTKCKAVSTGKFCSVCGTKTEMTFKRVTEVLSPDSVLEEAGFHECTITQPSEYYKQYIVNSKDRWCIWSNISDDDDMFILKEDKFDAQTLIKDFKRVEAKMLKVLTENFGDVKVEIGILSYWS